MNQRQFKTVTRLLAEQPTRRHVLRGLVGAGPALVGARLPATVAAKKKHREKKRKQANRRCDVCRRGCDFRGVQAAIDAARPGASLRLCPGVYRGKVSIDKNLTLIGAGRERSVLDGGGVAGSTAVLTVGSEATVNVRALTVTGGNGGDGGGIVNDGTLTLDGVNVTANQASQGGGILNHVGGVLTLFESRVSGNEAGSQGGGLFVFGGEVTLNGSPITANEAGLEQSGQGGGLFVSAGTVTLNRSPVTVNKTGHNGGGLLILNGEVRLNDSDVSGNEAIDAGSQGGGLKILGGTVTLVDSQVTANTAAEGGGIYNLAGDTAVTIEPDSVTGNSPNNCAGQAVDHCKN
jgi:hypothetical protein